jgi:hypothetical protein
MKRKRKRNQKPPTSFMGNIGTVLYIGLQHLVAQTEKDPKLKAAIERIIRRGPGKKFPEDIVQGRFDAKSTLKRSATKSQKRPETKEEEAGVRPARKRTKGHKLRQ